MAALEAVDFLEEKMNVTPEKGVDTSSSLFGYGTFSILWMSIHVQMNVVVLLIANLSVLIVTNPLIIVISVMLI